MEPEEERERGNLEIIKFWSARYLGKRKLYDLKIDETNVRLNRSVELNETDTSRRRKHAPWAG